MRPDPTARDRAGPRDPASVLDRLSRKGLLRSWKFSRGRFDILVGRGTIALDPLRSAEVARFAESLERDRVRLEGQGYPMGYATTRYSLDDGRLLDHHSSATNREYREFPYTVLASGGHPTGCAAVSFHACTRKEALALAGLVRGRCRCCGALRPLIRREHRWVPDPCIDCPGCEAGPDTDVVLLCRRCGAPIGHNPDRGRHTNAWLHTGTGLTPCDEPSSSLWPARALACLA
ncbi:hypothetical protein NQK81_01605 [Amycolatopsis roodepoortensis]|uniref:hypothetical protein n=1 Tax=Amycolatopsis roodepoortensis TaxID=700274 RepID=UPI00214B9834|nr:hypothetical protein [Amycolatopsis roodepoortensis]UUV32171.1 hypothetical protein NQK81_01605 [Amycolatopsis roodepoortensis]